MCLITMTESTWKILKLDWKTHGTSFIHKNAVVHYHIENFCSLSMGVITVIICWCYLERA